MTLHDSDPAAPGKPLESPQLFSHSTVPIPAIVVRTDPPDRDGRARPRNLPRTQKRYDLRRESGERRETSAKARDDEQALLRGESGKAREEGDRRADDVAADEVGPNGVGRTAMSLYRRRSNRQRTHAAPHQSLMSDRTGLHCMTLKMPASCGAATIRPPQASARGPAGRPAGPCRGGHSR